MEHCFATKATVHAGLRLLLVHPAVIMLVLFGICSFEAMQMDPCVVDVNLFMLFLSPSV